MGLELSTRRGLFNSLIVNTLSRNVIVDVSMNNLQRYRKQANLTQSELSARAGLSASPSRISNYESGLRQPSLQDSRALVAALAGAGAVNAAGKPVTLDDVFPSTSADEVQEAACG